MAKLFYDDEFDALAQTISNSDREFKQVAAYLFPHLKAESQYARLKNCLNPAHDERLSFGQIVAMCKFCGRQDALYFLCDELNHERPKAISPADKQAELMREFNRHVDKLERIQQELKASGVAMPQPGLKAV